MQKLDAVDAASLRDDIPPFRAGDTLKVHVKVIEGNRSRIQVFQGVVIARRGHGVSSTFTIRKVSSAWALSVPSRFTPPRSTTSRSSPRATCAAPSSTTCVSVTARPRRSRNTAPARPSEASRATVLGIFHGKARHRALVSGLAVFLDGPRGIKENA